MGLVRVGASNIPLLMLASVCAMREGVCVESAYTWLIVVASCWRVAPGDEDTCCVTQSIFAEAARQQREICIIQDRAFES